MPALAARIPPRHETVGAVELAHGDRPRAIPMLLQGDIDQQSGGKREACEQQHDGTASHPQARGRQHAFGRERHAGRYRQRRNDPHARVAQMRRPRQLAEQDLIQERELPSLRIEQQSRNFQIEPRKKSEHEAGRCADNERDHEAGAVHAGFPSGGGAGWKGRAASEPHTPPSPACGGGMGRGA